MITLREARPEDLDAVAALFLRCWREAYATVLPPHVIDVFDETNARELWQAPLETPGPGTRGIVAVDGDRVAGIMRVGRDPDQPAIGHVFSLYVDPEAQGGGIGGRLMDEGVSWLRAEGLTAATLWVFAANDAARRFYARHGWSPDGGTRVEAAFGEPEVRLRRAL